jgi:5'-3' exonuclease
MGIQYLNTFLKNNTSYHSIKKIELEKLSNKVISVDISIYLYRFLAEEALLENMYIMLSLFRYYNIIPIFVFDGKAPVEKAKLLERRAMDKEIAEYNYNCLQKELEKTINSKKRQEISENMIVLKKKFIRIKRIHFDKVQQLITAFGFIYIEANFEADEICARLVIKKIAYACLSEDMDLFVYGCPRVLRYLSLINQTVVIYDLNNILIDLNMPLKEFKEICILSGTDYNLNLNKGTNIYTTLKYYKMFKKTTNRKKKEKEKEKEKNKYNYKEKNKYNYKYKKKINKEKENKEKEYKNKEERKENDFYTWLDTTTNYIDNIYELYNIYNMFTTENIILKKFKIDLSVKEINKNKIRELMIPEGFIFLLK